MIVLTLLQILVASFRWIVSFFPQVSVLPLGIDAILVAGAGYLHFLAGVFPPIQSILNAFLYYLGFLILLKVVKLIPFFRNIFD